MSQPEVPTIDPQASPVGHAAGSVRIKERPAWAMDGFLALFLALVDVGLLVWRFVDQTEPTTTTGPAFATTESGMSVAVSSGGQIALTLLQVVVFLLVATPLVVIQPGQSRVVQFFGRYIGTTRRTGLTWVLPLTTRRNVSIRVNNFETNSLKVNDADGNPVELAAIVVWQIADTAKAVFAVEDVYSFVRVQSEAAVRHVATTHPYDDPTGNGTSLRGSIDEVSDQLAVEVAQRVAIAGVEIVEVRISHLAYAPEIAQAMLQRQQASAIVAARERIVDGAVGMVEMALSRLEQQGIVDLDEERKAQMVSNLLVVLCGDTRATPVVNTGSLYS